MFCLGESFVANLSKVYLHACQSSFTKKDRLAAFYYKVSLGEKWDVHSCRCVDTGYTEYGA